MPGKRKAAAVLTQLRQMPSQLRPHTPPLSGVTKCAQSKCESPDMSWQLALCHFPFFMPTHPGMEESQEISFLAPAERVSCLSEAETEPAWF